MDGEGLEKALQELRRQYEKRFCRKIHQYFDLARQVEKKPEPELFKELSRLFHSLRGSSATYGFHSLSQMAAVLEECFAFFQSCPKAFSAKFSKQFFQFLDEWEEKWQKSRSLDSLDSFYREWQNRWEKYLEDGKRGEV